MKQHGPVRGRSDIEAIRRTAGDLVDWLGPTVVAAVAGAVDRDEPAAWPTLYGPLPYPSEAQRLRCAHEAFTIVAEAEGADVARAWMLGGNDLLGQCTPVTALREDRYDSVLAAATAAVETPTTAPA